jgi:DNA repair protein RadC
MSYLVADSRNPFTDEVYAIGARHGKTAAEVDAFLLAKSVEKGGVVGDDVAAFGAVAHLLVDEPLERLVAVALNRRSQIISDPMVLTTGSDGFTVVCPKQLFRWALAQGISGATSVLLAHNHPSGDASPSVQDYMVTRRVVQAGAVIGIKLLDHIVVGYGGSYTSIRRERSDLFVTEVS